MSECRIEAKISTPKVNAYTYPAGPRGVGIKSVTQTGNKLIFEFDDRSMNVFEFPNWWFGTRAEYNRLTPEQRTEKDLYFIEEGT